MLTNFLRELYDIAVYNNINWVQWQKMSLPTTSCVPVQAITSRFALLLSHYSTITTKHCLLIDTEEVNQVIQCRCLPNICWKLYVSFWANGISHNQEKDRNFPGLIIPHFFLWDMVATCCLLFRAHSQAILVHLLQMKEETKQAPNPETFKK